MHISITIYSDASTRLSNTRGSPNYIFVLNLFFKLLEIHEFQNIAQVNNFRKKNVNLYTFYLLESIAEPSSKISSTTSGSAYSLSLLNDTSVDFRRNILLNTIFPCLLGVRANFSGGSMSITMQVVSSLIPRGRIAS